MNVIKVTQKQNYQKRNPRTYSRSSAYDSIQKQIRTKCGHKKCPNIVQTLAYRQLDPNPSNAPFNKAHNCLRTSLSSTFANRIQSNPIAKSNDFPTMNDEVSLFEPISYIYRDQTGTCARTIRTVMYQPAGLTSDSIVVISPDHKEDYVLFRPTVTTTPNRCNAHKSVVAQLDFDYLHFATYESRKTWGKEEELIFVHENAFNDITFKNAEESPLYNVPAFIVHNTCLTGMDAEWPELVLHSILFCQYETACGQVRNGKLHFRNLRSTFREYYKFEYHLGANRPLEHYYTELVAKPDDCEYELSTEHNPADDDSHSDCDCDECELLTANSDTNIGQRIPIEQSLPLRSYTIMHWDLIRTFHCAIKKKNCSGKAMHHYDQCLECFDIRYREPGYHAYPVPCAALCGYSNGNIRLCTYDRRFPPMRREIKLHDKDIRSVKFNPKNDLQFYVSGDGNFLRLYDLRMFPFDDPLLKPAGRKGATPVLDYHEHRSTAHYHQIILDPTTNLLVSSGSDNMVRFWNSSTGKLERCFDPEIPLNRKIPALPFQAFYSGDFRFHPKIDDDYGDVDDKGIQYRSEVLLTRYGDDYRMYISNIYNLADSE